FQQRLHVPILIIRNIGAHSLQVSQSLLNISCRVPAAIQHHLDALKGTVQLRHVCIIPFPNLLTAHIATASWQLLLFPPARPAPDKPRRRSTRRVLRPPQASTPAPEPIVPSASCWHYADQTGRRTRPCMPKIPAAARESRYAPSSFTSLPAHDQ